MTFSEEKLLKCILFCLDIVQAEIYISHLHNSENNLTGKDTISSSMKVQLEDLQF